MHYEATTGTLIYSLQNWRIKRDIPAALSQSRIAIRVNFGLYGLRWCLKGTNGLLTIAGEEMPYHIAHLPEIGAVIGPRDIESAKHRKFSAGWRESMISSINARVGITAGS